MLIEGYWTRRSRRFAAAAVVLLQFTLSIAPAAAVAIESHHDNTSAAHGPHHPGCPFDAKENCPHHRAAAGEPSLVLCGDGDALTGGSTDTTLRLMATEPVQLIPAQYVTAASAAAITSILAWHTIIPDTPPPRTPDPL